MAKRIRKAADDIVTTTGDATPDDVIVMNRDTSAEISPGVAMSSIPSLQAKLAAAQELIKAQAYLILCYRTRKSRVIAEKNVKLAEEKYKALGG